MSDLQTFFLHHTYLLVVQNTAYVFETEETLRLSKGWKSRSQKIDDPTNMF